MRKGEKSRIMIKPKYGYNHEKNKDIVIIPKGWEDKVDQLRKRRVFFEVKLIDWIVRHDLDGDGIFIKSFH
jgi:hypothetical protein